MAVVVNVVFLFALVFGMVAVAADVAVIFLCTVLFGVVVAVVVPSAVVVSVFATGIIVFWKSFAYLCDGPFNKFLV